MKELLNLKRGLIYMTIKIITDTGADVDKKLLENLDIDVEGLYITHEGKDYKDGIEINVDEVFTRQKQGENFQSSQVPYFDLYNRFEKYAKEGQDLIYVAMSSGISGCYNNGVMAVKDLKKEYPNVKMAVIDTKGASVGNGLAAFLMGTMAKKGATFEELVEFGDYISKNMKHVFTVFDMEYLYRGGRVSRSQKSIGKLLNIRPVIVTDELGRLTVQELSRGNKVYKRMAEVYSEGTEKRDVSRDLVFPVYGETKEYADLFMKRLSQLDSAPKMMLQTLGTTIGVHTGPGMVGMGYLKEGIPEKFQKYFEEMINELE